MSRERDELKRYASHPDKPELGTAAHFDFVAGHAIGFFSTSPNGSRDAFLRSEVEGKRRPHVSRRDVDEFPGAWAGLRAWVQGERHQAVDFTGLDFESGPTTRDTSPPEAPLEEQLEEPEPEELEARGPFVFTWAQNATGLDDNFFAALLVFCGHRGAELVVLPGRYRNPTSLWSRDDANDDWWDERLAPYMHRGRMQACEALTAFGDISIQPTAIRPLTGWEVFAGAGHAVFGHPKHQLRTIPGATPEDARIHVTTGAITAPNYTDTKAGKKGHAHHVTGACLVEIDEDGDPHIRQINASSDGSFIELGEIFSPAGVEPAPRPLALVTGDSHVAHAVDLVLDATFRAEDSITLALRPERVIFHDVLDFRARNHHEIGNADERFEKVASGARNSVEGEVLEACAYVDAMTPDDSSPVIVPSNHDEAFDRWLRTADASADPANARYFHEVRAAKLRHFEEHGAWISAFELAYSAAGRSRAGFLRRGKPYVIGGIALGFHGDKGANGSRGSVIGYSKLGVKTVIGHTHTPAIMDGCFAVGVTAALEQGYNEGSPSSWAHAHCIVYANGKRSLIFVNPKTGRWRGAS